MKKIFTFVLGAFMAQSASASIYIEFKEDQVTFEKGYDEVDEEYFWDFQGHIDGAYDVRVLYKSNHLNHTFLYLLFFGGGQSKNESNWHDICITPINDCSTHKHKAL